MDASDSEREILTDIQKRTLLHMEQFRHSAEESDRRLILFLAAQMDTYLRKILEAFLTQNKSITELFDGPNAPFSSLSGKTKALFLLGSITRKKADCVDAVRKVRNILAHELDASFDHPEVKKLCQHQVIFDGRLCDRDAFLHMGMNATLPLLYRVVLVKNHWRRFGIDFGGYTKLVQFTRV